MAAPPDLCETLRAGLDGAFRDEPDASAAVRRAQRVLDAAAATLTGAGAPPPDPAAVLRVLRTVCARAPFLAAFLERHPDWLLALARDALEAPRSLDAYRERLAAELDAAAEAGADPAQALRWFKYRELARITVRECSPDLVPLERVAETLGELSHLAEALIERALALASALLAERRGPPAWRREDGGEERLGFCVLGLGKLGNEELNYSSDVDLVYVHTSPSGALGDGPSGLSPIEYFTALAQELGGLLTRTGSDGFLYRVDLDLRPEGGQGTLVVSAESLAAYYEAWAATWEKAAMMKARPVAGDRELGWRALRAIDPMLYRSVRDWAAVQATRELKQRIEEERGAGVDGFDVKIGPGGIRDVEFVAQALQMLHGGRMPQVRARSTQRALERLAEVDVLPPEDARSLLEAYRFLRRLETRLQMEAERQTHRLPADPAARERVARALDYAGPDGTAAFERDLARTRETARAAFASFGAGEGDGRVLGLFQQAVPELMALSETRGMIERLASAVAREVDASASPERALVNLERFIEGVGRRRFYYELLLDRPELVPRLVGLFATSNYLSSALARHPRLIEPVFDDPARLALGPDELRGDLASIRAHLESEGREGGPELELDALRLFHHRQVMNIGLLDVGGKLDLADTERALTDVAEVCLEGALDFARREARERAGAAGEPAAFLVVAMGKLGSRELSYGSDLDVIFLFDPPGRSGDADVAEHQHRCARLAQRVISVLGTRTREGTCYEVDARLRPSGSQGVLVTSLASFRRYHDPEAGGGAQVWERQALLRARPLPFGDASARALAEAFEAERRALLVRPLPQDAPAEIRRIRQRMEEELARETRSRRDLKLGRGGLNDVETAVQYLQLRHAASHPELLDPEPTAVQLDRLEAAGLVDAETAATLRDGLLFLKRLSSRLRIVENRSISDLDQERGDLETLGRSLGYGPGGREGGARRALLQDYRRRTDAVREAYRRILTPSGQEP